MKGFESSLVRCSPEMRGMEFATGIAGGGGGGGSTEGSLGGSLIEVRIGFG